MTTISRDKQREMNNVNCDQSSDDLDIFLVNSPRKKADREKVRRAANAIRDEVMEYVNEYNVPFAVLR